VDGDRERQLVRAARKDPEAFGALYDEYFDKILSYTYRRTGNLVDAEDATSETFFKAMRNMGRFRWRGGGFLPWLYRIAANEVVNLQRKRKPGESADFLERLPSPVRDEVEEAERHSDGKELAGCLAHGLSMLDERDRQVVVLHYLQGESYSVISETTGIKENTLRVKAMRALRRLEEFLGKEGWDHGKARQAGWAAGLSGAGPEVPGLPEAATGV
jgi:RNA polymerase sigma-70 factor (ECF subfamily)